ncbi:MAG: hypothetical protein ACQEQL_01020 [Pseudomonadota bacterium]
MSDSKPTYKHILVPVPMAEDYEIRTIRRQTGTRTVQKTKGMLKPEKITKEEPVYEFVEEQMPTGHQSDNLIDGDLTGQNVEDACNALAMDGYEVISVTPLLRGAHQHQYSAGALQKGTGPSGFGYGYGYSITDSIVVLGKLKS